MVYNMGFLERLIFISIRKSKFAGMASYESIADTLQSCKLQLAIMSVAIATIELTL